MVNFLRESQTVILIVLLFWTYFFLDASICSTMAFPRKILKMLLSQFPLTFHEIHNAASISSHSLWLFLCWWMPVNFMSNKTKESITSQKLGSRDFWQIANSVLSQSKSAIHTSSIQRPKGIVFCRRTQILMTQVTLCLFSLLELIWNCTIFL